MVLVMGGGAFGTTGNWLLDRLSDRRPGDRYGRGGGRYPTAGRGGSERTEDGRTGWEGSGRGPPNGGCPLGPLTVPVDLAASGERPDTSTVRPVGGFERGRDSSTRSRSVGGTSRPVGFVTVDTDAGFRCDAGGDCDASAAGGVAVSADAPSVVSASLGGAGGLLGTGVATFGMAGFAGACGSILTALSLRAGGAVGSTFIAAAGGGATATSLSAGLGSSGAPTPTPSPVRVRASASASAAACLSALADFTSRGGPRVGFATVGGSAFACLAVRPFFTATRRGVAPDS